MIVKNFSNIKKALLLVLGNSNPRFSGVTSTMLQTVKFMNKRIPLAVMGKHNVDADIAVVSFLNLLHRAFKNPKPLVFHARRNNEMIQALLIKAFGGNIKIVFTSTAQRFHTKLTKFLMNRMDGLISTSPRAASFMHKKPDVIIPHGVDICRYHPSENKHSDWKELNLPGEYGIAIFGRVRPQKGIHHLIDASISLMAKYPDFGVIIVGETTSKYLGYKNRLMGKIDDASLGERIKFLGSQSFESLPKFFRSASLICALSENEGFGLTVLEAFASGTAVIATNAGAWPEIISNKNNGLLVPINDPDSVRNALEYCISCPERLSKMGINARMCAEAKYSIERESSQLLDFYSRFLN